MNASVHSSSDRLEAEKLDAAREAVRAQIADLSGVSGDAAYNIRAALEALLNSPTSASQLQASAMPLLNRANEIRSVGGDSNKHAIAYVLSEEILAQEQRKMAEIEDALFDEQFQQDMRDSFGRGGDDLLDAYDQFTAKTLEALERIDAALAQDGLTDADKQALLEERHAVLYAYTGELDVLLQQAEERGVEGLEPLAERVREQRETLEASPLSQEQRDTKLAEASREAAAIGATFAAEHQNVVMADETGRESNWMLGAGSGDKIAEQTLAFDEAALSDLSSLKSLDVVLSKDTSAGRTI